MPENTTIVISKPMHHLLRIAAAHQDLQLKVLVENILIDYFRDQELKSQQNKKGGKA